jgi:PAS domain S-box-containing protein/putative nucleotidyltransferase with HDIG domain
MRIRLSPAFITMLYAALAGVWIVASATLLDFAAVDPVLQGRVEIAKGLAFVILSSALLYLLLRGTRQDPAGASSVVAGRHRETEWRPLVALLAILALMVPLIGFAVFSLHSKQDEVEAFGELRIIADFKAREIDRWLSERRGDARALAGSTGFIERVAVFRQKGDEAERARIVDRLAALQSTFAYDAITLLDPEGRTLVTVGKTIDPPGSDRELARDALAAGSVHVGELYRDANGLARLYVSAPLTLKDSHNPVAVAVLHVNSHLFLYPLVREWPSASPSGETLLVRRDGDSALFLNELRHRTGTALTLRIPLADARLPAAIALNKGGTGTVTGIDYRGVPVLAAWQPVPGTRWVLLAKIDRAEALLAARSTANWTASVAALGLGLVFLAIALLFRQQRVARDLALQAQSNRLFAHFYELPFIGMGVSSPATKQWLQVNDKLCEMLGYTPAELVGRNWADMTHPDDLKESTEAYDKVIRGEQDGYLIEKRYLRKDGSILHVRLDARCVRAPDGTILSMVSTIEDITARRAAEASNRNLTRLYATLSRCNAAIIRAKDETALLGEVCRIAVESGGMRMAWVGLVEPGTSRVKPVASFGSGVEYLGEIHVSVDANDPRGRGPSGIAVREDHPVWCQDFAHDPRTGPWHEYGARYGWGGSASLPLHRNGAVFGCLTLYVATEKAFDSETRSLLTEIAADLSFGLDSLALEGRRRAAEILLIESEERYRQLFDNSQDGILLTDPKGRVLAANGAACRIFGRTREDLFKAARAELADMSDPRVAAAVAARDRKGYFTGELNLRRGNAEVFPAEISSAVFHEPGGEARTTMIVRDLTEKVRTEKTAARYLMQLQSALMHTVEVATTLSEMRDPYTAGHEKRVAEISVAIAAELGFDAGRIEGLQIAGYLHDIGKITIPSEILSKPGKLSSAEFELLKGHAQAGYEVLKNVDFPWPVANMVLQHHERIDGSGYPRGLKGDAMLLEAKILGVADVIEAMASHRPYRPSLGIEKALAEIERGNGTAYDPLVADVCLKLFREKGYSLPA